MSKINRLLIILLIILTLGVLIELGYYIFVSSKVKPAPQGQIKTPGSVKESNVDNFSKIINEKTAYAEASYLRNVLTLNYEQKAFSALTVTSEVRGTVVSTDSDGGNLDPKTPYEWSISVSLPNKKNPLPVFYTKDETAQITVTSAGAGIVKKAAFSDIKPGDSVSVKETYDLVNFRLVKGEISILN
jgi:hypothetical protein